MRKSRDSVRGVSESANCNWRENRGEEAWWLRSTTGVVLELVAPYREGWWSIGGSVVGT